MLRASAVLREIQYERSAQGIFPRLRSQLRHIESRNLIIRLLQKLDGDALPLLLELLKNLSQEDKDELLCALLQAFGPELLQALNRTFSADRPYIQVSGVSAEREADGMRLTLSGVAVDYGALLQSPAVREKAADAFHGPLGRLLGGRMVRAASLAEFMPDAGEKTVLALLEQARVREALLRSAGEALERQGIYLRLENLRMEPDSQPAAPDRAGLRLSPALEEALLDSAAACLRKRSCFPPA